VADALRRAAEDKLEAHVREVRSGRARWGLPT
jgi:hypothetical protein